MVEALLVKAKAIAVDNDEAAFIAFRDGSIHGDDDLYEEWSAAIHVRRGIRNELDRFRVATYKYLD